MPLELPAQRAQERKEQQQAQTTRLWVGNLPSSLDEATLIRICARFGKLKAVDMVYHKTGPHKGKPRGYAFAEYFTADDARKAKEQMNDQLVRGRKLVVTSANEPTYDSRAPSVLSGGGSGPARQRERTGMTTISALKSHSGAGASGQGHGHGQGRGKPPSTNAKIAALEAKLAAMRRESPATAAPTAGSASPSTPSPAEGDSPQVAGGGGTSELPTAAGAAARSETGTGGGGSSLSSKIDHVKAGLPSKPRTGPRFV